MSDQTVEDGDNGSGSQTPDTSPAPADQRSEATQPPKGRRSEVGEAKLELKPLDPGTLRGVIEDDLRYVRERANLHDLRAGRWDLIAKWGRLVVALAAALSAISLVGDSPEATAVLSILTAIVAALNAAFNPPDTSSQHRQSSKDYKQIRRNLDLLWRRVASAMMPTYSRDYEPDLDGDSGMSEEDLAEWHSIYLEYRLEIEQADDRAPAINRLRNEEFLMEGDPATWTWWKVKRFKKGNKRRLQIEKADVEFQQDLGEIHGLPFDSTMSSHRST